MDAIYQIGDANKVANIMYAIWDAYEVSYGFPGPVSDTREPIC